MKLIVWEIEVTEEYISDHNDIQCCIWLNEVDDFMIYTKCIHIFHKDWLVPFLKHKNQCLTCRELIFK